MCAYRESLGYFHVPQLHAGRRCTRATRIHGSERPVRCFASQIAVSSNKEFGIKYHLQRESQESAIAAIDLGTQQVRFH